MAMSSDPQLKVNPDELRRLIVDKYTAAELVDRLDLTTDDVLDTWMDEVYDSLKDLWEVHLDLGIRDDGIISEAKETD